jgi:dienelactone hydrolase
VHPGTAKGSTRTLHGLETYTAQPPSSAPSKGIIVIIPDAFGIEFINNKILADHYAAKGGYTVHLPDFMAGASAPVGLLDSIHAVQTSDSWAIKLYVPCFDLYLSILESRLAFNVKRLC